MGNINIRDVLKNYWKVRTSKKTTTSGADYTAAKWCNSSYAVSFYNAESRNAEMQINSGSTPYYNAIEHVDSVFSKHMYDKLYKIVEVVDKDYYNQLDQGRVDVETELAMAVISGSLTIYSMLCALYRSQNGYLYKDEDKCFLGPVFFNHDTKGTSTTDWGITPGNNSYSEDIRSDAMNNQSKIINSGQVFGCMAITNEKWSNLVNNVIANTYMTKEMRLFCEHLFTTVFIDPSFSYNVRSVTMFPSSTIMTYENTGDNQWNTTARRNLAGYDDCYIRDQLAQTYSEDNASTLNDIQTYFDNWEEFINRVLSYYPLLTDVFDKLGCITDSTFNFTRDLNHSKVWFVTEENIQDMIQSVALNNQNLEVSPYGARYDDFNQYVPFSVQDENFIRYGKTAEYPDDITVSFKHSFEYALKGKVHDLRFAYYGAINNSAYGEYKYHYLIPCTVSDINGTYSVAQALSVMYINTDLADYGAIYPLMNDHYSTQPTDGKGAGEATIVPSTRCYVNNDEDLGLSSGRAWDTFFGLE